MVREIFGTEEEMKPEVAPREQTADTFEFLQPVRKGTADAETSRHAQIDAALSEAERLAAKDTETFSRDISLIQDVRDLQALQEGMEKAFVESGKLTHEEYASLRRQLSNKAIELGPPLPPLPASIVAEKTWAGTDGKLEQAEQPDKAKLGFFERIGSFFHRQPKVEAKGQDEGHQAEIDQGTEKVNPAASNFWADIDKRFLAYVRGELTEAQQKELEQDKRWVAARAALETAATVFGAKFLTELSRASFTHQEFGRLQDAIKASASAEVSPELIVETAPDDRAKKIEETIRLSKYLTEEKKAELTVKVNEIMGSYDLSLEGAQEDRDREVAAHLDAALEATLRKVSAAKEAANTAMVFGTLGLGRSVMFTGFAQLERMVKMRYEAVQKEENSGSLVKLFGEASWKGFSATAKQFNVFDRSKTRGAKALDFGLGALTLAKYYGLATHGFELLPHKEAIDQLTDQLDAQAPHAEANAFVDLTHGVPSESLSPEAAPVEAPVVEALSAIPPETVTFGEAHAVVGNLEQLKEAAIVHQGDGITHVLARQIEKADAGMLEKMGFHGDFADSEAKHAFAIKEAFQIAKQDGYADQWLSHESIGKAVVLTEHNGEYHMSFADLQDQGATEIPHADVAAQHLSFVQHEASGHPAPTVEAAETPVLPEAPAIESQDDYFAVPGEDGTPLETQAALSEATPEAAVSAPIEVPAAVETGGANGALAVGVPETIPTMGNEAVHLVVAGHGTLDVPANTYSQHDTDRLVGEVKMRQDTVKAYKEILSRLRGKSMLSGDNLHVVNRFNPHRGAETLLVPTLGAGSSDRFLKQMENLVRDENNHLDSLLKDVASGRAQVSSDMPQGTEYASTEPLNRAFAHIEAKFKRQPFSSKEWEKLKTALTDKWKR